MVRSGGDIGWIISKNIYNVKCKIMNFESYLKKKNRQQNGQKKTYKKTNNDLQNIHIKLKIK